MNGPSSVGTTSTGLLRAIRSQDRSSWQRLLSIYSPLVYGWTRRVGFQEADAADITQDVMMAVLRNVDTFEKSQAGDTFRGWLRTICKNKINDVYRRRQRQLDGRGGTTANIRIQQLDELIPADDSSEGRLEMCRLRQRALEQAQAMFKERVWRAFWRTAIEGDKPDDVAEDLGMSVWAVYKAKTRVLTRLRQELEEFT